eukprot:TRINITY_DN11877_c0_g1_i1.p1 TRINITY_DN11877_c0_g1~~TRINITY_DN11877_c0_g1_i1.p1  ORF type:complete len:175 (-),score=33.60 TRINITY_DN11877_c0_g1_i1:1269-1793(-)
MGKRPRRSTAEPANAGAAATAEPDEDELVEIGEVETIIGKATRYVQCNENLARLIVTKIEHGSLLNKLGRKTLKMQRGRFIGVLRWVDLAIDSVASLIGFVAPMLFNQSRNEQIDLWTGLANSAKRCLLEFAIGLVGGAEHLPLHMFPGRARFFEYAGEPFVSKLCVPGVGIRG